MMKMRKRIIIGIIIRRKRSIRIFRKSRVWMKAGTKMNGQMIMTKGCKQLLIWLIKQILTNNKKKPLLYTAAA